MFKRKGLVPEIRAAKDLYAVVLLASGFANKVSLPFTPISWECFKLAHNLRIQNDPPF